MYDTYIAPKAFTSSDILGLFLFCKIMEGVYDKLRSIMNIADNPLFIVNQLYDLDHIKDIIGDRPIKNFIPLVQTGADTKVDKFKGIFFCHNCMCTVEADFTKMGFIEAIKNNLPLCQKCDSEQKEINRLEKEAKMAEDDSRWQKYNEDRPKRTDDFILSYCGPKNEWNKSVKNRYRALLDSYRGIDESTIMSYLKNMNYYEFLKTPYWVAIAYEVKRRANFKCAICNSNQNLAAHHRTYDIRGNEIDSLKDLTCLCNDCHEKHHNI